MLFIYDFIMISKDKFFRIADLQLIRLTNALFISSIIPGCTNLQQNGGMKMEESSSRLEHSKTPNSEVDEFNVESVTSAIAAACSEIKEKINRSILIIGDTGSGKSTLINGLIEKNLFSYTIKKGMKKTFAIDLKNNQEGAKIGATAISETTVPKRYSDKNNILYWDCPGFEDTKGAEQDICNAFCIKRLFENSKEVKVVLVLSKSQI